jgi:hypothetical protein
VVRSLGSVAAVVAASLAIVIGVLAWNAGSNVEQARPPGGGQAGAPLEVHSVNPFIQTRPPELVTGGGEEPVHASTGGGERPAANPPVHATFSGGGGHVVASPPVARGCNAGLLGSLVSLLGGLLGGGGGC